MEIDMQSKYAPNTDRIFAELLIMMPVSAIVIRVDEEKEKLERSLVSRLNSSFCARDGFT